MTSFAWVTVGTTIGIVSPWLYLRMKNRPRRSLPTSADKSTRATKPGTDTTGRYAAKSFYPCLEACPAAWKLQDEKFLAGEVPALPLADCNQRNCDCRYLDHDDRRSGEDQRDGWGQFGGFVPHAGTDKRRTTRDRREKTS